VIEAKGLSKWFGQVMALNQVTVTLGEGITGLLGPNGAGKTTFLRMMTGQLKPSQGTLTLDGERIWNNPHLLSRIGFCPEEDSFYDALSGLEFVTVMARLSGLDRKAAAKRSEAVLEQVGMTKAMHRLVQGYSRGMRQRTKLAQALVHDPDVLFLDEPLTGTDPVGRRELRRLISDLGESGKRVVVSSHVLHEVEALTSTIVLIHRGRVVADGDVHAIRGLMDEHPHRVVIRCERPREVARALVSMEHVVGLEVDDERLLVQTLNAAGLFDALPGHLIECGVAVKEYYSEDDNLGAVFRYLVDR
jgi:ABC-2 type transport system ATP-binding protein